MEQRASVLASADLLRLLSETLGLELDQERLRIVVVFSIHVVACQHLLLFHLGTKLVSPLHETGLVVGQPSSANLQGLE